MTTILLSQPFLVLFGVILLMIVFKSKFQSTTDFLENIRKRNINSPITNNQ